MLAHTQAYLNGHVDMYTNEQACLYVGGMSDRLSVNSETERF